MHFFTRCYFEVPREREKRSASGEKKKAIQKCQNCHKYSTLEAEKYEGLAAAASKLRKMTFKKVDKMRHQFTFLLRVS